jgi:A/G-specific adenine glycosylase
MSSYRRIDVAQAKIKNCDITEIQRIIMEWGKKNYKDFPWRYTTNKFHALLAEIMLQRTRAEQVLPIFEKFALLYSTPLSASKEDPAKIRAILQGLGLKWRIETMIKFIETVNEKGFLPDKYEKLILLPGVGHYVASAFLSLHNNIRMPIIDSNVVRLYTRVFGLVEKKEMRRNRSFECLVDKLTPIDEFKSFNYSILDFTRAICRPKPLHDNCPLSVICEFRKGLNVCQARKLKVNYLQTSKNTFPHQTK